MNTLPAQIIKRRGITAVDDLIAQGDVHITRNNQPQYVVLSEERYRELLEAQDEGTQARLHASLADLCAGRVRRFTSADELMEALEREDYVLVGAPVVRWLVGALISQHSEEDYRRHLDEKHGVEDERPL